MVITSSFTYHRDRERERSAMADSVLECLLEKIRHLLNYDVELIVDAKTELEKLEMDLRLFKSFLLDSTSGTKDGYLRQELIRQTRSVVYEAEDVIDNFVAQAFNRWTGNCCLRAFHRRQKLLNLSQQVENVSSKFAHIRSNNWRFTKEEQDEEIKASEIREDDVVGFEDEVKVITGLLREETRQLDVISIVGMPGIGKTTLARKIFRDPRVEFEFPTLIWIPVTKNFTHKDIYLTILRKITKITDDLIRESSDELARRVVSHLNRGRFLIVMDDVWSTNDWERLRIVLPKSNTMGKVLITTCNEEVGRHANKFRHPHKLRFLTESESWDLLQFEVFGRSGECPEELEMIGKLIAKQCDGLPLALVVMGGILVQKEYTKNGWLKALQDVPIYRNEKFYVDLPVQLQVCFLYLAMFPPDFEIPAWQLIQMWIAEGFIRRSFSDGESLEETGENYLKHLINRNLIFADRTGSDGKVKTCRIHHMLHEFCKIQAGKENENVVQEIKFTDGVFEPQISELPYYRRLCIHSNVLGFLSSEPFGPSVRSLVSFSREEINLPPENHSAIPTAFKLLKVLDFKPIRFSKIPSGMYQLVHLSYLTLSCTLAVLPVGFSKFRNMQTLVVVTTSRMLEIKADIWKLAQLRHFKTNASATLPKASKSTKDDGEKLQTLGMISPQSCTEEVFGMARNLKKLGIRGQLSMLFDGKKGSIDSLGRLISLEKLKLINDVFPSPSFEDRLHSLPPAYMFPPRLRSLTLANTFLDWSQMFILGLLEKLEVLKLKDNAFVGRNWITDDGGFRCLEALHIDRAGLVNWVTSAYHFPRLARLELHNCEELREVPIELADIPSLLHLDLFKTKHAAASANTIFEKKQKYLEGRSKKDRVFKLSIYPPING